MLFAVPMFIGVLEPEFPPNPPETYDLLKWILKKAFDDDAFV